MTYRAPQSDLLATMAYARRANGLADETADAAPILAQAAQFAEDVLVPLDRIGDRHGVTLDDTGVRTAPGWAEAYRSWTADGWNGLASPEAAGGSGLSRTMSAGCFEIWSGANLAFALAGLLTTGAIEALDRHGSQELRRLYLPRLVSGAWPGTMNLTEPQAGSDLGALRCRAERAGDGTYRLFGQKIYITYGDHDMTENILHLVLARLPDAPPGSRGLSLFLVPKRLLDAAGEAGEPNDLRCVGLEAKLGQHGAPTCTMAFGDRDGAVGFLIGAEHKGLACMFTMMNNARLSVGLEGVAAAEHATQRAIAYAQARRQGRDGGPGPDMAPIVRHPDVGRMLLIMKSGTAAARCLCYLTAAALDAAVHDTEAGRHAAHRAALLTPVAKAWSTDLGNEIASLGIQVHGGSGYIEATGAAQVARDIRIAAIYEGTNGIQAIDLVTRKLPLDGGAAVAREIGAMHEIVARMLAHADTGLAEAGMSLGEAVEELERCVAWMGTHNVKRPGQALAVATPFLRLFGIACGGTALAGVTLAANNDAAPRATALTRGFAAFLAPEALALGRTIRSGEAMLGGQPETWLSALTR